MQLTHTRLDNLQKKGKVGQQAVQMAQMQAQQKGRSEEAKKKEKEKQLKDAKKESDKLREAEMRELFKPVQIAQKVRTTHCDVLAKPDFCAYRASTLVRLPLEWIPRPSSA